MSELAQKHCVACEGGVAPLSAAEIKRLLAEIDPRWQLVDDGKVIEAQFDFKNYYHTTAFVNAAIFIAHQEDHHPDIRFGYKQCSVRYWTHAVDGLTENDFICAARIDALSS